MHSNIVGGSTAARRIACAGSMALEAKMPNESSSYAQEGTDLHTIMESLVEKNEPASTMLAETVGSIAAVTHEQVNALAWCQEIVDAEIGKHPFELEVRGAFPNIEGAFGTADVVVFGDDGVLTIMDYKFGKGVYVSAADNAQLIFYGLCVANHYGLMDTFTEIRGHILQPRLDNHSTHVWTRDEALAFNDTLVSAIENARDEYTISPACGFCSGKSVCPAHTAIAQEASAWREIARDELPRALSMVEDLEAWCKAVRKDAHSALTKGANVQGWKLVQSRGKRVWGPSEKNVEKGLRRRGLTVKDFRITSLITPPAAEKLLGVEAIETMIVKETGTGTTLVRESDKRVGIDTGPRDLTKLAQALSSTQTGDKT